MTERKRSLGSNLAKVDAHVITQEEYDEIPELTEEWFAKATPMIGGRVASAKEFREAVTKAVGGATRSAGKAGRSLGLGELVREKLGLKSVGKIGLSVGKIGLKSASKKSQRARPKSKLRKVAPRRKRA
jgi:hypothetical protein